MAKYTKETTNTKRLGQILESKNGSEYIKFTQTVTFNEGDVAYLNRPATEIDYLVETGRITADEGVARKAKIPSFVKRNVVRAGKNNSAEGF